MIKFLLLLLSISPMSCTDNGSIKSNPNEIGTETSPQKKDSAYSKPSDTPALNTEVVIETQKQKKNEVLQKREANIVNKEEPIIHRFQNQKISVVENEWKDGEQLIEIFSINDSLVYSFKNIKKGYTENTELYFRENGSLEKMITHTNPGASQFWFVSTITFSEINEPLWKVSERMPLETLDSITHSYWNKKTGTWIKQETIECNPPRNN